MPTRARGKVVGARSRVGTLVALLGGFGLQPAVAQDHEAVTVDVGHCTGLASADARLACFGAEVDAVLQQREPKEADERTGLTEGIAAGQAERSGEESSSRRAARSRRHDQRGSGEAPSSLEAEYSGSIVAVRERLPNAYVITLDNGQVWQQTEPKRYPLRPGLEVRIYPTRWGNYYRLNGLGTGGHIQVQKVE